jgi:predicted TPR repeat methyltransferase
MQAIVQKYILPWPKSKPSPPPHKKNTKSDLLVSTAAPGARWRRCADLGCGTGLMGPLLRPLAARLEGVDLSKLMCQKARDRGCYDEVEDGEIVAWLDGRAKQQQQQQGGSSSGVSGSGSSGSGGGGGFDLLVAADVLVYIGDLGALFAAAAAASEPG